MTINLCPDQYLIFRSRCAVFHQSILCCRKHSILLGGENNVHAKPLVEAWKAARAKSPVPPVSKRLTSCRNFLERARKRVTRAEDLIAKAVEQKTVFMQEIAEAEERLKQLEAERHHQSLV